MAGSRRTSAALVAVALLPATFAAGVADGSVPREERAASVTLVVGTPGALTPGDSAVRSRLEGSGHSVVVADDNTVTAAAVMSTTFAIITSSVNDGVLGSRLTGVSTPLWVAKPYLMDNYGLAGPVGEVDYGSRASRTVDVVAPDHPLAAGRSGTVSFQTGASRVSWARPAASADVVARTGAEATIFTIAAGEPLAGGQAAHGCRMTFPIFANAPATFTTDGWAMFDAAAQWAVDGCSQAPAANDVLLVVGAQDSLTPGEAAVRSRLLGAGYGVVVVDDSAVSASSANGKAFALLSSNVDSASVGTRLRQVPIPVWIAKPYLFDDYGLTGTRAEIDYGNKAATSVTVTAPGHPMAAGRTGTVQIQTGTNRVSWGRPAASATVVAEAAADATIFTVAAGAVLADGQPAAGCRLTFPLFTNAPAAFTANGWAMFDATAAWAAGGCGDEPPPPPDSVEHVVLVSVDGLNPKVFQMLGPSRAPTFYRLMAEGVSTLNARTAVERTQTLPNHASIATGRKVGVPGGHGVVFNEDPGTTIHDSAGEYVASAFDVVHDYGGSTALFTGKDKFAFYDRSWAATTGAPDTVPPDNGRDKIDSYLKASAATTTGRLISELTTDPREFTFVHFHDVDTAGHTTGWLSDDYLAAVSAMDGQIDRILDAVAADPDLAASTVVIVTTDHGGIGTIHSDFTLPDNYTVPIFVWGADVDAGSDLYELNPDRLDPGTTQPAYTAPVPPIRTGELANLVTELLGLPPVAGSTFNTNQSLDVGPAG